MPKIHSTAIVDPKAQIAADVEIGPGCVVYGGATIGPGCRLIGNVYLAGKVTVGPNNVFYPFTCIGFEPQDRTFTGESAGVRIGNHNIFREGFTAHRSTSGAKPTTIGNECFFMTNSHVAHDCAVSDHCTLATGAMLGGHAVLEDHVFLGGMAGVHQHCRMGRLSLIGGGGTITSDLPPFCIADGKNRVISLNLIGLRRSGIEREAIDHLGKAFNYLYLDGHTRPVAVQKMRDLAEQSDAGKEQIERFANFVDSSQRGVVPHAAAATKQKMQR